MGTSAMILGNDRRILVIEYLQKREGKADLRDVVEYIAEKEGNTERKHRKSIYVSLMQTHIPKMEREGVISYEHGMIKLIKVPLDVNLYMEVVSKNDISWSTFYIGTSLIFIATGIFLNDPPLMIAAMIYALIALIHHQKVRRVF
ncbi:hypothetical protein JCM16138_21160 [Thermococcus atlanticus]